MLLKALKRLVSEDSLALVLVEQHAKLALQVTRTALVMRRGKIVHQGDSDALLSDPDRLADLVMAQ
jgi:branched-chain amino acid transport system ATP-binding protein